MTASKQQMFPFYWIDAFTEKRFGGNPCAVLLNSDSLTTDQMQTIAREMNLSETAFVFPSKVADFGARYFTPTEELPFAGHPTLAVVHALIEAGAIKSRSDFMQIRLEVPAGVIPIEISAINGRTQIVMSQLKPEFLRTYDPKEVLPVYGLAVTDLLPGAVIQTVSTGTPILMIPLASHEALRRIQCDPDQYERFKETGDFRYAHHFCVQGATPMGATFARSLGTPPNGLEDPFTGSSTGCMAAYLWKHRLIDTSSFVAEQGHWMGRPGRAEVEVIGVPDNIETVKLRGEAVTLIRGEFELSLTKSENQGTAHN